jgi:putative membrane protein
VSPHESRNIVEKKSAINLVLAFAIATKHYLREEFGYKYADLSHLLSHITATHVPHEDVSLIHKETFDDVITTMKDLDPTTNIPLEISYYIASYINYCQNPPWGDRRPQCDISVIEAMQKGNIITYVHTIKI